MASSLMKRQRGLRDIDHPDSPGGSLQSLSGFVQNGQRLLAARGAESNTCQTLQTPGSLTGPVAD